MKVSREVTCSGYRCAFGSTTLDIRAAITDLIIQAIESDGLPPWRKGWKTSTELNFNLLSGNCYSGMNQLILLMQGRADPRWLTLKQCDRLDGQVSVRKGEHGVRLVRMVSVDRQRAEREAGSEHGGEVVAQEGSNALVMKTFTVFNASQIDGLAPLPERLSDTKPHEAIEAIVHGMQDTGMKLNFGGNSPAYWVRQDAIHIPVAADFEDIGQFHSTLAHEICHASGHPKRLARLHLDARFGSSEYAREELRAELGSIFLLATLGGELAPSKAMLESNAAYISSWLDALRRDKGEIFRAAADAQRICDYLSERALAAQPKVFDSPKEQVTEVANEFIQARAPLRRALG